MRLNEGPNRIGLNRKTIMEEIEGSLKRLQTDHVDIYYAHQLDVTTPVDETMRAFDDLVRQGKVRYLGCSNFAAWHLGRALWTSDKQGFERFESVQPEYNFSRREIERELIPLCLDRQVSVIPYQLLMGGVLTGGYQRESGPPDESHMASRHVQRAKDTYWNDTSFRMVDELNAIVGIVVALFGALGVVTVSV